MGFERHSKKRRQYSPEFKAKIALAAIRGEKKASELPAQYEIHPTMLNTWKRQLLENASTLFDFTSVVLVSTTKPSGPPSRS